MSKAERAIVGKERIKYLEMRVDIWLTLSRLTVSAQYRDGICV
jgi:hypothetical protein